LKFHNISTKDLKEMNREELNKLLSNILVSASEIGYKSKDLIL